MPGTGKTVYLKAGLEALDKSVYNTIQTAFSAQTSANMVRSSPMLFPTGNLAINCKLAYQIAVQELHDIVVWLMQCDWIRFCRFIEAEQG